MDSDLQQREVDGNYDAFARSLATLLPQHRDKFALMHDRKIVAFFHKPGDAYRNGLERYGEGVFSIQEVTDAPIDLGFWSHAAVD